MSSPSDTPGRTSAFARRLPAVFVYGMLLAYSAAQAPVPAVNEPHYLGKAKHLWDPAWCPGDFFLDSSNPHLFFYLAVGWLTRLVSLGATAWAARAAGYALLAVGWAALARRVAGSAWGAVPSAAVFLLLASLGFLGGQAGTLSFLASSFGSLSGEWLVGGIEGKVFAYGLLFLAIAFRLDGRWGAAAACLGGAVSFHPIVGVWGLICGLAAEVFSARPIGVRDRRALVRAAAVFLLCALPGLVPAAWTLVGTDPRDAARATYIQVFIRLSHHLDPTKFPAGRYAGYGLMLATWMGLAVVGRRKRGGGAAVRWFAAFVVAAVAVALIGVAIGWHGGSAWAMPLRDLRGTLLKFYPFRLADVFVPLAFSLGVARLFVARPSLAGGDDVGRGPSGASAAGASAGEAPGGAGRLTSIRLALAAAVTLFAFAVALAIPSPDRNPSRLSPGELTAWVDACRWVRANTPEDSLIVAPSRHWGFKWLAGRAEYVNYKDAPQDAPGLLEWERRLGVLRRWWESSPTGEFSADDLRRLGDETGGGYLLTLADAGRFAARPAYENGSYRVYRLR